MVVLFDLLHCGSFSFIPGVSAVLPVIVICIGVDMQTFKQPVGARSPRILINELVTDCLLSFAKNTAAFSENRSLF